VLRGECRLVADWTVVRRGGKGVPSSGRSAHTERAGETYAELVAAQSRLVGALSRDIAAAASSN
jgi:uncharacterized lipoprotein YmbA